MLRKFHNQKTQDTIFVIVISEFSRPARFPCCLNANSFELALSPRRHCISLTYRFLDFWSFLAAVQLLTNIKQPVTTFGYSLLFISDNNSEIAQPSIRLLAAALFSKPKFER